MRPGARVGPYEVIARIGAGGMGEVWRASDTRLGREVAIKVLPPELAADPERLRRFEQEARAMGALSHPNVVAIFDVGAHEGVPYLVEELLDGESLRVRLVDGPLPVRDAVGCAIQIARGLAAAHARGIVHRDLKPENIIITSDGTAKILDFGIAKLVVSRRPEELATTTTVTGPAQAGTVLGTIGYMSPEQVRAQPVDQRSDIFSFGCVLYEMLSGRRAFAGETAADTMSAILSRDPPPLAGVEREGMVPASLERMVARCLEKKPEERFASAHDLALALLAFLAGSDAGLSAPAPGAGGPKRRVGPRLLVAAASAGAVLVAAGLWQRSERAPLPAPKPGIRRVAVLPFENLGDPEDAYFADGMSDEVRGKLASLSGLAVIARASCDQYKGTGKPPAQIAAELGAPYLLTARVRWDRSGGTNRIRVTPELVEVTGDAAPTTRWQDSFDAELKDVFRVQSEIASRVARSLEVALGSRERERLAERPTANLAAYDAFLRGQQAFNSLPAGMVERARVASIEFGRAVALDPSFALAWARLSRARTLAWGNGFPSQALAEGAREAAARAVELAPDLAETRFAAACYRRWVTGDVGGALAELETGLAENPRDADLLTLSAVVNETRGDWDQGLADLERAVSLDPRSAYAVGAIGRAQLYRRRYPEARAALGRALALDPAEPLAVEDRLRLYIAQGDAVGARTFVAELSKTWEPTRLVFLLATEHLAWLLDREQQQDLLRLVPSAFGENSAQWELVLAREYAYRGAAARAREHAERAAEAYASRLAQFPELAGLHASHGLALAILGRRAEALREGERAVELRPIARDAYIGPWTQLSLVRICILVGAHEKALDALEPLLRIPCFLSPAWLAVDPMFAPLKGNPRFEKLLKAKP
jgi:TolB-like protein/tetratricopeptide (TPR) repeat protein